MRISKNRYVRFPIQQLLAIFLQVEPSDETPIGDVEFYAGLLLVAIAAVAFGLLTH
jgi:hypothetical protein